LSYDKIDSELAKFEKSKLKYFRAQYLMFHFTRGVEYIYSMCFLKEIFLEPFPSIYDELLSIIL